jgi:subtilase family serine protease
MAVLAVAVLAAPAANASTSRAGAPARVELRGTVSPLVAKGLAHVVGTPSASKQVTAVVAFKPRNAILLQWLAQRSSGRAPMSNSEIRRLFAPRPATVAAVRAYLNANGLSVVDSSDMSLVASGTAAAANAAFGVNLRLYRDARGFTYQAPLANVRLPEAIASVVQSVAGLDESLQAKPHYQIAKHASRRPGAPRVVPHTAPTGCTRADTLQHNNGGFQPADLSSVYGHDADANHDGTGELIGLVEFSSYTRQDSLDFQNCYSKTGPGITGILTNDHKVSGGTTFKGGQVEVNLDIQVAMGGAPDAHWRTYIAPNNLALLPTMLAKMRSEGVTVVSDSWGLCELFVPIKLASAENVALEQLALAGVSFYVASGDDGAADCRAANPDAKFLAIDDPSGSPFATAVGGTNLDITPSRTEKAWKGSGGGISINYPKPGFQRQGRTLNVPGGFCSSGTAQCRETPDVALDAAPQTGYIIRSHGLGGTGATWNIVGGTSGAAPLMAAITADANESVGGGVNRLGYANPFLYGDLLNQSGYFDITQGNNVNFTGNLFQAGVGYDMVTGLGAPEGDTLATVLATYAPAPITFDTTRLTATHPLNLKRVKKGTLVTFSGVLTDTTKAKPLANRQIIVIGSGRIIGVDRTGTSGKWETKFKVKKRMSWHAVFMGSGAERPDSSPTLTVRIQH